MNIYVDILHYQDHVSQSGFIEYFMATFLHIHSWLNWVGFTEWGRWTVHDVHIKSHSLVKWRLYLVDISLCRAIQHETAPLMMAHLLSKDNIS